MACEVVNAYLNSENENEIIVDKVVLEYKLYYSISDAQSKRSAVSYQEWIQKVITRNINVKANTLIAEIRSMIRI